MSKDSYTVRIQLNEPKSKILEALKDVPNKAVLVAVQGDRGITNFATLEFKLPKK